MSSEPKTLSDLAAEANGYLVRSKDRDIVLPAGGAPEWFGELCRTAHQFGGGETILPDDWRYEFIQDALNALENDDSEDAEPDLDSLYPYTSDRLKWLSSRLDRTYYCDEAMGEMGKSCFTDTDSLIAWGMCWELREVYQLVRTFLTERLEELAEDAAAAMDDEG